MGSFEKLGILVIVVIIVMILAVAIHQWGGTGVEAEGDVGAGVRGLAPGSINPPPFERDLSDGEGKDKKEEGLPPAPDGATSPGATWPGGTPRSYTIQKDDMLWKLVVQKWRLKDSFIREIAASNPKLNVRKLRPGQTLVIPDPAAYRIAAGTKEGDPVPESGKSATYEVQEGDSFESIAKKLFGRASLWAKIEALNPGINPRSLQPGQVILVPLK